jgi:hypothetical protein
MKALFGPSINRNGYQYCHTNDEELIFRIENSFMVMHQQTQVPNTHMINSVETRDHM